MTTWIAYLTIDNQIENRKLETEINFRPFYTYNHLYQNLKTIFDYPKDHVIFICKRKKIKDWTKFLLNQDYIYVALFYSTVRKYLLVGESGDIVTTRDNVETIYRDLEINSIDEPLLLWLIDPGGNKIQLIDVLDNPMRYYNDMIDRMIRIYKY